MSGKHGNAGMTPATTAAGIDALVARLHAEGVAAGEAEAARLTAEARVAAEALLAEARTAAAQLLATAARDAERARAAATTALELARRDAILATREALEGLLSRLLAARVSTVLDDPLLLAEMVRAAVAALVGDAAPRLAEIGRTAGTDGGIDAGIDAEAGPVARHAVLVEALAADIAAGDIRLAVGGMAGVLLRPAGAGAGLELSEATIVAVLQRQLSPRFRALLDGDA